MSKKVLITGGTGFIGQNIVNILLEKGYEVHSLVYPPFAKEQKGLVQHEMNLMDIDAVDNFLKEHCFENLIHLAWFVGAKCHTSNVNIDWVISTLSFLKSFQQSGGKKFLMAGSISEYEYKYGYLTEDLTPTNSGTLYGEGKNVIYKLANAFCKQNDMDFKCARIFNVYGQSERAQRLMPSVINSCLKGEDVKVSDCLKFQDYLHVEDMANGIVTLFESELYGAVNICSGEAIQLRKIVERIAELTEFKGEILWGAIPAAFGDNLVVGNNEKLKSIGWTPKYNLEEGLKQTIKWWKNNNKEKVNV
ncbi:MAG: NAD(P)-dependent oxidoreductase [Candidatus Gastranaerophilales bacterium]